MCFTDLKFAYRLCKEIIYIFTLFVSILLSRSFNAWLHFGILLLFVLVIPVNRCFGLVFLLFAFLKRLRGIDTLYHWIFLLFLLGHCPFDD